MYFCIERLCEKKGQATVEAAFLIPVLFTLLLLLIQPGIILYNHMVMQAAASEGCRLLATRTDTTGVDDEKYEGYIVRRLGSIPPQDNFHIHSGGCSWEIELAGNEASETVQVTIKNRLELLPLFDIAGKLFGLYGSEGVFVQEVSASMPTQPAWVQGSEGGFDPQGWIEGRQQ